VSYCIPKTTITAIDSVTEQTYLYLASLAVRYKHFSLRLLANVTQFSLRRKH